MQVILNMTSSIIEILVYFLWELVQRQWTGSVQDQNIVSYVDLMFHQFDARHISTIWFIISISIFIDPQLCRCVVLLLVNSNIIVINLIMADSLYQVCFCIIINKDLCSVWVNHKITIILMVNIVSNHRLKTFVGNCGSPVEEMFLSVFLFDNIYFAYPDNHLPELDFLFPFNTGIMCAVPMQCLVIW